MSTTSIGLKQIPVKKGLPFIGNIIPFFIGDQDKFLGQCIDQYGDVFSVKLLDRYLTYIYGVEGTKFILENDNKLFAGSLPESTQNLFGKDTLTFQSGDTHTSRRRIISKAFIPRALSTYSEDMIAVTNRYLSKWAQLKCFDWHEELNKFTFDVACKLMIGLDDASEGSLGNDYKIWGDGIFSFPLLLPGSSYVKAGSAKKRILQCINEVIQSRKIQSVNTQKDVLDILLVAEDETGYRLSDSEIQDQILTLLFAGHGTLTSALSSLCLLFALNPEILERCRTELSSIIVDDQLPPSKLNDLTYLGSVLRELLRLLPPAGGGFRVALQDCEYDGYHIPKGATILYSIRYMHHSNEIYPEQHIFNPERYTEKEMLRMNREYSYIPYGRGVRDCLGREFANLEMRIFAALLIKKCNWQIINPQSIQLDTTPFVHPVGGLPVKFG